jgi:signal-transduction protein with cAMP-binding, CBS, and nucleotidyltransferase domain
MNRSRLEWMKEQIEKLDITEHTQIHGIVMKDNAKTTQAPNGIFVSSEHLSQECLKEIEQYILYCIDQRSRMDEDLKTRKTYERMVE